MNFYEFHFNNIERKLPIVQLTPKVKVASFNLLGDAELVQKVAEEMVKMVSPYKFDCFVGPEVKVVPILQEMSRILKQDRYVVFRKNITGYMINPVRSKFIPGLILDGRDAQYLKGKRVIIIDDVVTTGKTLNMLNKFLKELGATIVANVAFAKQEGNDSELPENFLYVTSLPVFRQS